VTPGFQGNVLVVDLSRRSIHKEELPEEEYRRYFGGTGFAAKKLLIELEPGIDPLEPENVVVFAAGPLTGGPFAGTGRISVSAKSPLTDGFGTAEGGGFFGAEMRRAGFDAVVVRGKSETPVYLFLHDGTAEIRDASRLVGKTTHEAETIIKEELGDRLVRVSQCGVAGEKLVRFAGVANDVTHYAGRTGIGAVMGSKNLRAIAARGKQSVSVRDRDAVRKLSAWMNENWKALAYGLYDTGTAGGVMALNAASGLPTRNFREGIFEGAEKISGQTMRDTVLVERGGCYACPIRCKRVTKASGEFGPEPVYGGPEYETIGSLGSCCGVDDLEAICRGNEICNAYGLDTISAGVTIAFAMECFENGVLTLKDTDGIELRFGNGDAMVKILRKIAMREGIGDLLAEGTVRAAQAIGKGAAQFAMHVRGQEVPMHEPRLKWGLGLGYGVSITGADHMHNMHDTGYEREGGSVQEVRGLGVINVPIPAQDLSLEKVHLLRTVTMMQHFDNCAVICNFIPWSAQQKSDLVRGVTGWETTPAELLTIGERSHVLARVFNIREGLSAEDERLPRRFFEAFREGALAGKVYDEDTWNAAKLAYYRMSGWTDAGIPRKETLARLGISWASEYLPASERKINYVD